MTAQTLMIWWLIILSIGGWWHTTQRYNKPKEIFSGILGVATRYGLTAYILYCGGFWRMS